MLKESFLTENARLELDEILQSLKLRLPQTFVSHVAILDIKGELVGVSGPNPLHYASFEACVKSLKKYMSPKINEVFITNDPYSGNTRMCDLMFIQGAFGTHSANELRYYIAVQITLPQLLNKNLEKIFSSIEDEGFRIPPSPLDEGGLVNPAILDYICQSGFPKKDLMPLMGEIKTALKKACADLIQKEAHFGRDKFMACIQTLRDHSEKSVRKALHDIPDGEYEYHDFLDNDGISNKSLRIQCKLTVQGENILINFTGSSKQTAGPFNCNYSTTLGACFTTLMGFLKGEVTINSGSFRAFSVEAQEGTLVNVAYPYPLLGGYYETSRRISDVLKGALSKALPLLIPSFHGGSSSLCFMKFAKEIYSLHIETLGCGSGASAEKPGAHGIKADFENSPVWSVEELETHYPIQIVQNSIRDTSGGSGKFSGGKGITRGYKFSEPASLMLLGDRKEYKIHGFFGGISGANGELMLLRKGDKRRMVAEKCVIQIEKGDVLFISTPSGAGWGKEEKIEEVSLEL